LGVNSPVASTWIASTPPELSATIFADTTLANVPINASACANGNSWPAIRS
jgi:hypothetical protein